MPSSGSTTSFSASVTSSTLAGAVPIGPVCPVCPVCAASRSTSGSSIFSSVRSAIAHSFVGPLVGPLIGHSLGGGVAPGRPAQQRTLHPGGELRDAGERDAVLQNLFVRLDVPPALHQLEELLVRRHA